MSALRRISAPSAAPRHFFSLARRASSTSASHSQQDIIFETKGDARIYTLNRPKALNALSFDMLRTMSDKADEWREDSSVKLVIGLGEGRAFAAGGDIKAVVDSVRAGNAGEGLNGMATSYRLNWKAAHFGKPYVAFIDGIVMGGGAGLSLPADIRIATRRTVFALPEQRIGFSPDVGSYFLTQLDGEIGTWLAVTGNDVYGRAAYELGIATHYVAEESVPEIAARIAELAPSSPTTDTISALVAEYHIQGNNEESSKKNPDGTTPIRGAIRAFLDATFSLPSLPAIYRRLQDAENNQNLGPDVQAWAKEQRATMDTRGPTGMAVAVHNYHMMRTTKQFVAAIDQDMCIGAGFVGNRRSCNDLVVGAVHSLFEKNKSPIPFQPSITDLDNPSLQPESIRAKFLTRSNLPEAREPELIPAPTDQELTSPDVNWGHFRAHGIPSEDTVRVAADHGCRSEDELLSVVLGSRPTDARHAEFVSVVKRTAKEKMYRDDDGTLRWST